MPLRRETPIQYPCCSRERLWVAEDLKERYRNGRNEWMNEWWSLMDGDLRGTGGTIPSKFEVGTAHAFVPPNILRSSVCPLRVKARSEYKKVSSRNYFLKQGFFPWTRVIYDITRNKIGKIWKTWSMTKKRLSEIFGVKLKKVIQKSWSAKSFSVPPNSAPGLRLCDHSNLNQIRLIVKTVAELYGDLMNCPWIS